jgi:hypothetical protein
MLCYDDPSNFKRQITIQLVTKISKKTLIYVIITWGILTLTEYYFVPYFIVALLWLALSISLCIILVIELLKAIKERKALSRFRITKVIIFAILLYLTFNPWLVNGLIEKADWAIFYNKRMNIIEQVKEKKLNPNVSWNGWICELPFEFPVISNGGNDIGITRNEKGDTITVTFWVFRNFFSSPSTHFIYTNDSREMKEFEDLIKYDPKHNWKIRDNWYRTFTE